MYEQRHTIETDVFLDKYFKSDVFEVSIMWVCDHGLSVTKKHTRTSQKQRKLPLFGLLLSLRLSLFCCLCCCHLEDHLCLCLTWKVVFILLASLLPSGGPSLSLFDLEATAHVASMFVNWELCLTV